MTSFRYVQCVRLHCATHVLTVWHAEHVVTGWRAARALQRIKYECSAVLVYAPSYLGCDKLPCLHVQLDECMRVCRPWALNYAEDEQVFFSDYVKAHLKLSELGSEWAPEAP